MDPATLAYASATVLLVANVAQFLLRVLDGRKPQPSSVPTAVDCERIISGRIYEHEVKCSNLKPVLDKLDQIEATLRAHIQYHLDHS